MREFVVSVATPRKPLKAAEHRLDVPAIPVSLFIIAYGALAAHAVKPAEDVRAITSRRLGRVPPRKFPQASHPAGRLQR